MSTYYARIGTVQVLPAFSEFLEVPQKWFLQEAPRVVEHVATMTALPIDEKHRFQTVIALYHNVARYERLTGNKAPINPRQLARAMLNIR
jgi:hypothetical protein